MKKIMSLVLLSMILLVGCNKNIDDKLIKDSYNYENKVRYELPTDGYSNVEEFLTSINRFEYKWMQHEEPIDYTTKYSSYNDLYFFKYNEMNVIMRSLDDYVCLQAETDKIKEEVYFSIKIRDSIFSVIDKLGLPHDVSGSGFISIKYKEVYSEYYLFLFLDFNAENNRETNYINQMSLSKRCE